MTAKQYKPIISKVIKEGKRFNSSDEFVDHLIAKMGEWEEMFSLAVESMGVVTQAPAQDKGYSPLIVTPSASSVPALREEDASSRFGAKTNGEMFAENFTKEQLFQLCQDQLPPRIQVHPPKCNAPIVLEKRVTRSPGESKADLRTGGQYMTGIRIYYGLPGVTEPSQLVTLTVNTTDKYFNAGEIMEAVTQQANSLYSSQQRVLPPQLTFVPQESLRVPNPETGGDGGVFGSAQIDDKVDMEALNQWGAPSAPQAAANWKPA